MYAEQLAVTPGRVGDCAQCMKLHLFWDDTSGGGVGVERLCLSYNGMSPGLRLS